MVSPTEAHAAVERLTAACEYGKVWPSIGVKTADLALLLALLKEAGKAIRPFAEMVDLPDPMPSASELHAAAKLAELLPSMEGE